MGKHILYFFVVIGNLFYSGNLLANSHASEKLCNWLNASEQNNGRFILNGDFQGPIEDEITPRRRPRRNCTVDRQTTKTLIRFVGTCNPGEESVKIVARYRYVYNRCDVGTPDNLRTNEMTFVFDSDLKKVSINKVSKDDLDFDRHRSHFSFSAESSEAWRVDYKEVLSGFELSSLFIATAECHATIERLCRNRAWIPGDDTINMEFSLSVKTRFGDQVKLCATPFGSCYSF